MPSEIVWNIYFHHSGWFPPSRFCKTHRSPEFFVKRWTPNVSTIRRKIRYFYFFFYLFCRFWGNFCFEDRETAKWSIAFICDDCVTQIFNIIGTILILVLVSVWCVLSGGAGYYDWSLLLFHELLDQYSHLLFNVAVWPICAPSWHTLHVTSDTVSAEYRISSEIFYFSICHS